MSIPPSEAQIDTTNESQGVINNNEFFVVSLATINTVFIRNGFFFFFFSFHTQYRVMSAAFSKMLWSGWRKTLMFP